MVTVNVDNTFPAASVGKVNPFLIIAQTLDKTDLDEINAMVLFSTLQESRHVWAYDARTLRRTLERGGFAVTGEIDRHRDPRLSTGQWYQVGLDCIRPVDDAAEERAAREPVLALAGVA